MHDVPSTCHHTRAACAPRRRAMCSSSGSSTASARTSPTWSTPCRTCRPAPGYSPHPYRGRVRGRAGSRTEGRQEVRAVESGCGWPGARAIARRLRGTALLHRRGGREQVFRDRDKSADERRDRRFNHSVRVHRRPRRQRSYPVQTVTTDTPPAPIRARMFQRNGKLQPLQTLSPVKARCVQAPMTNSSDLHGRDAGRRP